MKRYTESQLQWLKDKTSLPKYKSKTGRIRIRKIREAFEKEFKETRSKPAIGYVINNKIWGTHSPRERGKKRKGSMTLSQIEKRISLALESVRELKKFIL